MKNLLKSLDRYLSAASPPLRGYNFRKPLFQHSLLVRKSRKSQGYSLIVVLLLVLTVMTTVISLNSRIIAGQYGESLQGKLRMARNAAENGLVIASSELNKPGNRLLLGRLRINEWSTTWDRNPAQWPTSGQYYSLLDSNAYNNLNNDCKKTNPNAPNPPQVTDPNPPQVTEQAVRMPTNDSFQLETGGVQSSRIISFKLYDVNHTLIASSRDPLFNNQRASATENSFLEITAQGYYNSTTPYQSSVENSWKVDTGSTDYTNSTYKTTRFVLTQEYDVVPRCCGRSFSIDTGFGNDTINTNADLSCSDNNNRIVEWYVLGPRRATALQPT